MGTTGRLRSRFASERRALLRSGLVLAPAALAVLTEGAVRAQVTPTPQITQGDDTAPARLPNGKSQTDAILKAEYDLNVKDARELTAIAKSIELDFDKNDQNVLSLALLKKLDDVEKITKRIRTRVRK